MSAVKKNETRSARTRSKQNEKASAASQSKEHEKRSEKRGKESTNKSHQSKQPQASRLAAGKSATTTDHETIQRWVEDRGGSPATVKATEKGEDPGMLRINFPGYSGEDRLENIPWVEFFKKFDEKKLAFLYQDETRDGETSRFWKLVSREGKK